MNSNPIRAEAVERAARAIFEQNEQRAIEASEELSADPSMWLTWDTANEPTREPYRRMARAALEAGSGDGGLIERLHAATAHGDDDHRVWLLEAYTAFFAGEPVPEPRGTGNKEARIAALEIENAQLRTALSRSDGMGG
jgi:hypothetical protein